MSHEIKFNGRPLTGLELEMYASDKCIGCGATLVADKEPHNLECSKCHSSRTRVNFSTNHTTHTTPSWTVHQEFRRRIGVSVTD